MRFITWYDDIAIKTFTNFEKHFKDFYNHTEEQLWGNVAEALVQKYYNQPINDTPKGSDDGWDMEIDGTKIDVKTQVNSLCWFGAPTSYFVVECYKPLKADYYLFCQIDPATKAVALAGYLTKDEVELLGRFYKQGDHITPNILADCDFYDVRLADIHPINP